MLRPSNGVDTVDAEIGAWNQNAYHFSDIDKWFPALYSSVKKSHQSRPRFQVLITNSIEIFPTYCTNILMWFSGFYFSSRMLSFIPRDRRRQKKRERMNDKAHKKKFDRKIVSIDKYLLFAWVQEAVWKIYRCGLRHFSFWSRTLKQYWHWW